MTTPTGEIIRTDRGPALRFERRYAFPPDEVWSALTTPERARRWLGELTIGGGTPPVAPRGSNAPLRGVGCRPPDPVEGVWALPRAAPTPRPGAPPAGGSPRAAP